MAISLLKPLIIDERRFIELSINIDFRIIILRDDSLPVSLFIICWKIKDIKKSVLFVTSLIKISHDKNLLCGGLLKIE